MPVESISKPQDATLKLPFVVREIWAAPAQTGPSTRAEGCRESELGEERKFLERQVRREPGTSREAEFCHSLSY